MFSDADRAVMKENYRNSRMGREAINVMISKVEDDDLALDRTGRNHICRCFYGYRELVYFQD